MRLAGMGAPDVSNPGIVGDMIVILKVDIPTAVNQEYKETVEELIKMEEKYPSVEMRKFHKANT